jgi:hypothetical protein
MGWDDECFGGEVGDEVLELHGVSVELDRRHLVTSLGGVL